MDEIDKQSVDVALLLEREINKRVLLVVADALQYYGGNGGNMVAMENALDRGDSNSVRYFFCDLMMETIRRMVDTNMPQYDLFSSSGVDAKIRNTAQQEIRIHEVNHHTPNTYTTTGTGAGTGIVYTSGTAVGRCSTCGRL